MGTQLEKIEAQKGYAQLLSQSNLLPQAYQRQPANVLVAMAMGEALNLKPIEAINSINVIKGRPALSAELMGALVRRAGHKLRVEVSKNPPKATATLIRKDDPDYPFTVTWDLAAAKTAGLIASTPSWRQYPDQMLRARAITEVCRMGAPDALNGFVYTAEELGGEPQDPFTPEPVIQVEEVKEPVEPEIVAEVVEEPEIVAEVVEEPESVKEPEPAKKPEKAKTPAKGSKKSDKSTENTGAAAETPEKVDPPENPFTVDQSTGEILDGDPLEADRAEQIAHAQEFADILGIPPENMQKSAEWVMGGHSPAGTWDTWPPRTIEAVWRGLMKEAAKRGLVESEAD